MNTHAVLPVPASQASTDQPMADLAAEVGPSPGVATPSEALTPSDHRRSASHGGRVLGTIKLKRPPADKNP